jgi:hypothetical protein
MLSANPNVALLALNQVRFAIFTLVLAACATKPAPSLDETGAVGKAQAALGPFKTALKAELGSALAQGPEHAVDVCSSSAPRLASEHSTKDVRVGRSALRLRNAENAPPAWLLPVMDDLAKTASGSTEHRVVRLPDGGWGYAERYPTDTARGFHIGDFRGVFYAEVRAK